jgi:hypothetical protein
MKSLLILPFLILFFLTGCQDKEDVKPDPAFELLKGEWVRKLAENVYYNSSGLVENRTNELGIINYTITEGKITTTQKYAADYVFNFTYTTSKSNGKRLLTVTYGPSSETYELVSITEQNMVWRQEKTDFVYYIGTDWRKAAKYTKTITFEK